MAMKQHGDVFNLPNTERGRELIATLMRSHQHCNIDFRVTREQVEAAGHVFTLLVFERLSKRPGEGQIAANMKARRA